MASAIKNKISKVANSMSNDSDPEDDALADQYMLRVTAGPSYDASTHKPVFVNSDKACTFENEFIKAKIKVRIRNYTGLPEESPKTSPYFDHPLHTKDQYSIGFSFVPKKDLPSKDVVWGNDFDHPVKDRLPPGFNTAFKIVKEFVDPGLSCDAYADQPWVYGPALSCWFALRVGEKAQDGDSFPQPDEKNVIEEGADGDGAAVRKKHNIPDSAEKRRKHFLDASHRQEFSFEKGRCYQGDFFNPYIDFGKFKLRLPGFSLNVLKHINDKSHTLRYTFKNRETGDVYFAVVLTLLFGEELRQAQKNTGAGSVGEQPAKGRESKADVGPERKQEASARRAPPPQASPGAQQDAGSTSHSSHSAPRTAEPAQAPSEVQDKPMSEIEQMLRATSTQDKSDVKGPILT
ncbi:hypothetical protein LTR66_007232 [Elasticomyces elasticus]|nr:hypothetical protein LTR66_007232 [Elasticomyces elasticus]KAK5009711.1 hypothetical protein LTR28_013787 [Elasticomyces elasticus]